MKNSHNYNVIVMIENTVSSKIWKEEIEQLQNNFTDQNEFETIHIYHFDKNDNKNLVVKNSNNEIVDIQKSLKEKNNLVFIVSDVCSTLWHNNQAYKTIQSLSEKSLVSIINILPKSMWRGLSVDTFLEVKSTLPLNIKNNAEIINKVPSYLDSEELEHIIIMPMVELHETDKLFKSIINGGTIQSTFLYDDNLSLSRDSNQQPQSAKNQANSYMSRVFQPAVNLATYFSNVDTFTISELDFVRKQMLPETDKSTVAQFLLGGIVDKENINNNSFIVSYSDSKDKLLEQEIRYKMKPGIAQEFKRFLNNYEDTKVQLLLKERIQEQQQKSSQKLKM